MSEMSVKCRWKCQQNASKMSAGIAFSPPFSLTLMAVASVIIANLGDIAIVILVIAVSAVIAFLIAFTLNVTKPFMINSVFMIIHFHDIVWHCHGDRQHDSFCQYDSPITMITVVVLVNATVFMRAHVMVQSHRR